MLSFQRLDVYQRSVEFLTLVIVVADDVPRGQAAMLDQLRRAASSIPRNIAEAAGRTGAADAARHFAIARGSAMECAAALDVCRLLAVLDDKRYERGTDPPRPA